MSPTAQIPSDYTASPELLKDRVILVTGAGDGIGRGVARAYAAHGATVILLGRTTHKLEAVYDEILAAGHPQPAIFPLELHKAGEAEYAGLIGGIATEFGRLDGVLHNAAELGSLTPIDHYSLELWQRTLMVNLTAPFMLTQACLPLLRQAPDAAILFSSTDRHEKTAAYWGAYGVSKQGLDAFMFILADELENNSAIRVNAINPGPLRTHLRSKAYPGENPNTLPEVSQILPAYLYLMGADSTGIRGQLLDAQKSG
ncbi:YciK family oxidoreductase [Sulfuriflexus mobilis]|uniref:YciK family oxidoreductase n=1 Tax=Sulfuriflexus mobilis TaxID=1811807 RepID=UPI000F825C9D|nr:YciK family oxidoreductase [Sulfuriflexus mobilis]